MTTLPAGWIAAPIGDLCDLVNGRAFKPSEWSKSGLPIIRIQNLNKDEAAFNFFDGRVDSRHQVDHGDLLFAWSGTPGTSFGAHIWKGGPAVLNQHIYKVVFDRNLMDSTFFKFAIDETLEELISQAHGGVGLRHVTKGTLQKTKVALPPLGEQRRIATAINTSFERISSARLSLDEAISTTVAYKEAILRRAFGDVDITSPSSSRLCARLTDLVDEGPTNGWSPRTGPDATGPLTLKLTATTSGRLRLDDGAVKRIYEQIDDKSRYWLRPGDLLVQRANSLEHLGSSAIFEGPINTYIYPDLMMRIRIGDASIREYVWRYLNSPAARLYIRERATGTAGNMPKISGETLRNLPIPLPVGGDYASVTKFIETEFEVVESVGQAARASLEELQNLSRSVLDRAFNGELVDPDPADEPARILLEKIKRSRLLSAESSPVLRRSPTVRRSAIIKGEGNLTQKRRADVAADYLKVTLGGLGGAASAKELWRKSDMEIDEFYKQLRAEMKSGGVSQGARSDELVVRDAA